MIIYFRENTWNCVENRRNRIENLTDIRSSNSGTNNCPTTNCIDISTNSALKVLIERPYRLCHSKKLYCILLYYEPPIFCGQFDANDNVPCEKFNEYVMPIVVCREEKRQRSRRRRRRRHLNSFCDNFKTI